MEIINKKCNSKEHIEIDAILYCKDCNVFMCNKCDNFHSKLCFHHNWYNLGKNNSNEDIFTGFCKEEKHNTELEYFCKAHNQLCCSSCLCKIKGRGKGQHSSCDVCHITEIKEKKKNTLNENIKILEELTNKFEESINKFKIIFEKMINNKEKLKIKIQNIFTRIRNVINEREDELLMEIDEKFNSIYFNEDILKESEKLPIKINKSLEKGKLIEKEWNNDNKLIEIINSCINIEKNIKDINSIYEKVKKLSNSNEFKIDFFPSDENEIIKFLNNIKNFGFIGDIFYDSLIINNNNEFICNLKKWIKSDTKFTSSLLYRKTRDGNSFDTFHELCDNQGPTLVLIKSTEGFIIGGYTPLDWDKCSKWKCDSNTFLFSLTNNEVYKKKSKSENSILCSNERGPWFAYLGFGNYIKNNMSQVKFFYRTIKESAFENYNNIIPNEGKDRLFDVEEVEIYKIFVN